MGNIKMTSLMMTKYGDINKALEFQQISKPTISSKQILIKTKAASYNPLDYKIIRGDFKYVRKIDFPKGIGRDVSGTVEDIGSDVEDFKIGDYVFSRISEEHIGTMAEYVVSNESDVSLIPSNLNFTESASIPLAGLTVYQSLVDIAKLSAEENILIYAGSGGVGTIAIQLSKHLRANVTTTTRINASYRFYLISPNGRQLNKLAKLYEKESIKPVIDNTYTFEESIAAINYLSKGHAKGKVVIEFPD